MPKTKEQPASTGSSFQSTQARKAYNQSSTIPTTEQLVEEYLPLVKSVLGKMRMNIPSHVDFDDLHSVGVTGLMAAIHKYDPSKGKTFVHYSLIRIRGAILDELRRMDWMPRANRSDAKKLQQVVRDLEVKLNRPATEEDICKELGLDSGEYAKLMDRIRPVTMVPLDKSPNLDEPEGSSMHEAIADDTEMNAREEAERNEMIEMMRERITKLPEMPRKILAMYYFEDMRLAEIAEVFGLTESRICQIHSQAVISLRAYLTRITEQ